MPDLADLAARIALFLKSHESYERRERKTYKSQLNGLIEFFNVIADREDWREVLISWIARQIRRELLPRGKTMNLWIDFIKNKDKKSVQELFALTKIMYEAIESQANIYVYRREEDRFDFDYFLEKFKSSLGR